MVLDLSVASIVIELLTAFSLLASESEETRSYKCLVRLQNQESIIKKAAHGIVGDAFVNHPSSFPN